MGVFGIYSLEFMCLILLNSIFSCFYTFFTLQTSGVFSSTVLFPFPWWFCFALILCRKTFSILGWLMFTNRVFYFVSSGHQLMSYAIQLDC